ncbi:hypothetical protein BDF14DRAFT_1849458 [Spinellus fusiger]|nr:hypothetical protein BDF14DRAFT_1849458 [Spinellus fusiger]
MRSCYDFCLCLSLCACVCKYKSAHSCVVFFAIGVICFMVFFLAFPSIDVLLSYSIFLFVFV